MGCGCGRTRSALDAALPPSTPRVTKFEVATDAGIKRFDTVTEAQQNRRSGALIRTVRA